MRRHRLALVLVVTTICCLATPALADTVYLKNGRTIRVTSARMEGDLVHVRMFGGELSFPAALVDRIVEDQYVEREATPEAAAAAPGDPNDPNDPSFGDEPIGFDPNEVTNPDFGGEPTVIDPDLGPPPAAGDPTQGGGPPPTQADPPPPDPQQTREYWQARLRPLSDEIDRIDRDLAALRRQGTAQAQRDISRAEARKADLERQIAAIGDEARRLGVPPGWLR